MICDTNIILYYCFLPVQYRVNSVTPVRFEALNNKILTFYSVRFVKKETGNSFFLPVEQQQVASLSYLKEKLIFCWIA